MAQRAYPPTALAATASVLVLDDGVSDCVLRLFTPEVGLLGQGVRYVLGGSAIVSVYLVSTMLLALVAGLPFEVALAIGFCVMIAVNCALHRMFVWMHREGLALPIHRQLGRYMTVASAQYGLTVASTATLPGALGVSAEIVYLVFALSFAAVCFLTHRDGVFCAKSVLASASARTGYCSSPC